MRIDMCTCQRIRPLLKSQTSSLSSLFSTFLSESVKAPVKSARRTSLRTVPSGTRCVFLVLRFHRTNARVRPQLVGVGLTSLSTWTLSSCTLHRMTRSCRSLLKIFVRHPTTILILVQVCTCRAKNHYFDHRKCLECPKGFTCKDYHTPYCSTGEVIVSASLPFSTSFFYPRFA